MRTGIPQRINGKVSGTVNGISFHDEDLHSYVITSDGRAYTAVSKIPETIGYDLQPLSVLGGVVGWLFARPTGNAPNGYQLTGKGLNAQMPLLLVRVCLCVRQVGIKQGQTDRQCRH